MDKESNNSHNRRRTNIFLIFLACSALIWLISKLSETYTERTSFAIDYVNAPDSLLFVKASKEKVNVQLSANGFQFFYFNIGKKNVRIDLSQVKSQGTAYFVGKENYRSQIENQLPGNMSLLQVDEDTLYVRFEKLFAKTVKIIPDITLQLAPNHMLEGELMLEPSTVEIKGPKNEVHQINEIRTVGSSLSDISDNFSVQLELAGQDSLSNTYYSQNYVQVSGRVFRFSEQLIEIPVKVINLPDEVEIRTFPNTISTLCKARIDLLKSLRPQDFELVADFQEAEEGKQILNVKLLSKPEGVYDAQITENKVEFILIRR